MPGLQRGVCVWNCGGGGVCEGRGCKKGERDVQNGGLAMGLQKGGGGSVGEGLP